MALWAPFLLVHLGGQDNITAYALEDNKQALAVQVAAAAYVLYESSVIGTEDNIRYAAILMFVVGALKYGERVWALQRASCSKERWYVPFRATRPQMGRTRRAYC
ncbi:hypothetical protein ACQ4PT_007755 [Festuca glaucescens]